MTVGPPARCATSVPERVVPPDTLDESAAPSRAPSHRRDRTARSVTPRAARLAVLRDATPDPPVRRGRAARSTTIRRCCFEPRICRRSTKRTRTCTSSRMIRSRAGRRMGDTPLMFEIDPLEAVDIDEEHDFIIAELLHQRLRSTKHDNASPSPVSNSCAISQAHRAPLDDAGVGDPPHRRFPDNTSKATHLVAADGRGCSRRRRRRRQVHAPRCWPHCPNCKCDLQVGHRHRRHRPRRHRLRPRHRSSATRPACSTTRLQTSPWRTSRCWPGSSHSIDRGIRANGWPKPPGKSLRGLTLGIIGLGGIGRAVARPRRA